MEKTGDNTKRKVTTKTRKYESTKEEGLIQKSRPFFVFSKFRAFVVSLSLCTP